MATRQAKKSRKKKFAKATHDFQKRPVASKRKSLWDVILVKQAYLYTTILVSWLKVKDPSIAAEVAAGRIKLPKAAEE